ncbi:hypothetical protein A3O04_16275 [Mycobacteroides abscessus]|nr:hypothetical protein A3O04_16275 [Mycobacteroides abscessus]
MTNTETRNQNSHHLDWGIKAPLGRVHAPVAESEALIEPFLRRCKEQEDMYVAAGFPLCRLRLNSEQPAPVEK